MNGTEPCIKEKRSLRDFILDNLKKAWEYYRGVRPNNLTSPKYKHLFLLLYWPLYGLVFLTLERFMPDIWYYFTETEWVYHTVECWLDQYIPFCEAFVIPYYFWFVFMIGLGVYSLLFDIQTFRRFMWFIILTYTATTVIYLIYPTMQDLRPTNFPEDNLFILVAKHLYDFDTNTNVCPSIHVLGSMAVCLPGLHCKKLRGWGWKAFFIITTALISASTVFLKQHSAVDIGVALLLSAACYPLVFKVLCPTTEEERAYVAAHSQKGGAGN